VCTDHFSIHPHTPTRCACLLACLPMQTTCSVRLRLNQMTKYLSFRRNKQALSVSSQQLVDVLQLKFLTNANILPLHETNGASSTGQMRTLLRCQSFTPYIYMYIRIHTYIYVFIRSYIHYTSYIYTYIYIYIYTAECRSQ